MGVVWRNNDLNELRTRIRAQSQIASDQAEQVIEMTVREAADMQKDLLNQAVTMTGAERIARGRGNTAGRNYSGNMIDAISDQVDLEPGRVIGRYGWIDNLDAYFQYQDFGTGRIPAANSLLDSFVALRMRFISRMRRIAGK